jgi:hypothetical protein
MPEMRQPAVDLRVADGRGLIGVRFKKGTGTFCAESPYPVTNHFDKMPLGSVDK